MKELRGTLMIVGAAVLWGASATAAKALLNRQVDTLLIVQTRVTFSFLLMLGFFLLFAPHLLRVRWKDLWRFALLGIGGVAGANFTYYFTIKESTVATAILIQYTAPLLVMAYAALSGEEHITLLKIGAALVSLFGCFLAVGAFNLSVLAISPIGIVSGIGSTVCFAFMTVFTRHLLARYRTWSVLLYSLFFASLFWIIVNPPWRIAANLPAPQTWGALGVLAVMSILIPHSLYFGGLRSVVPTRAIIVSTLEPVVAIVSAAIFLGEYLGMVQTAGAVLVLLAIMALQARREPPAKEEADAR